MNEEEKLKARINELEEQNARLREDLKFSTNTLWKEVEHLKEGLKKVENMDWGFLCQCGDIARTYLKGKQK
jgi:predicted nuclease with TOPRIM domain